MHWSKAHGISVARIREILQVPKRVVFVSEETRDKMRRNLQARGPEALAKARMASVAKTTGKPSPIAPWVRASMSKFMKKESKRRWQQERQKMLAATQRGRKTVLLKTPRLPCEVCGEPCAAPSSATPGKVRKTCSDRCHDTLWERRKKISDEQVLEIRRRLAAGETQREIAEDFRVARETVGKIGQGTTRKNVS
jgi:hypothetical protein